MTIIQLRESHADAVRAYLNANESRAGRKGKKMKKFIAVILVIITIMGIIAATAETELADHAATARKTGTLARCGILSSKKVLNVKSREQSNSYCCSGASIYAVAKYFGVTSKSDVDIYNALGKGKTVVQVTNYLNNNVKSGYSYVIPKNKDAFYNAIKKSIDAGYPVIALISIPKSEAPFKYSANGHYVVVRGYEKDIFGGIKLYIADSYNTKENGGTFTIDLDKFYSYALNRGAYLILKKN